MDAKKMLNGITRPVAAVAVAAKLASPGLELTQADANKEKDLYCTSVRIEDYADDAVHGPQVPKAVEVRAVDLRQITSGAGQYFAPHYFAPSYSGHLGGMQRPPSPRAT